MNKRLEYSQKMKLIIISKYAFHDTSSQFHIISAVKSLYFVAFFNRY